MGATQRNQKTAAQLEREIAYFERILQKSRSRDRLVRAARALAIRRPALKIAELAEAAVDWIEDQG